MGNCWHWTGTGGNVVLLAGVIEAKTAIKLLRRLGITLIALPEPVTTPFGVALVLLSRYLSRRLEASQDNRLRETVKYYLAHTMRFSDDADGTPSAPGLVKRHTQSEQRPIPWQYAGSRSFIANSTPSVWQNWQEMRRCTVHHTMDMQSLSGHSKPSDSSKVAPAWSDTSKKAEKVIRHTINVEWLSRRYESAGAVAYSSWACTSNAVEGAMHHPINMSLLSQRYKTGSVGQAKVKYHAINEALLLQRYGSAVSSTTVLNALQHNNYYYDIVCRGNVIGGY
jgi:hypothetical protein